jgi:hypothetical protein
MSSDIKNNEMIYAAKLAWHRVQASLPIKEKIRILLQLQRQDLELIKQHRPLKYYEKPWEIEP